MDAIDTDDVEVEGGSEDEDEDEDKDEDEDENENEDEEEEDTSFGSESSPENLAAKKAAAQLYRKTLQDIFLNPDEIPEGDDEEDDDFDLPENKQEEYH